MAVIHAARALTAEGWRAGLRMRIENGRIAALEADQPAEAGDERHEIALAGMPNLHSHAFQRAMAGLAETRGPSADSFWSWREVMYRMALTMTPDQVEAVAAELYVEMLEAGFTRVGEFHYLHHEKDGRPYSDIAEMASRIAAAAGATGIGLTLLPVFYAHSGFGGAAPTDGQRRFVNDLDGFARLLDGCRDAVGPLPEARVGIAPHSLRAVTLDELSRLEAMAPSDPIHIHVAEQVREVEDCVAFSGCRPVELLLDKADVSARWCLIHATHMTPEETARMAKSGAAAGLCPVTEANLGDGIFPAADFLGHGGRYGVGSDSNVLIGLTDELRQLEYSQRLALRSRNVLAEAGGSTGRALFDAALQGGNQALGCAGAGLRIGAPADIVTLRAAPGFDPGEPDRLLDAWIFAGGARVEAVWVHGVKRVAEGRHLDREKVTARFAAVLRELQGQL